MNGKTFGTIRHLYKLKLRSVLWTEFLFKHVLRYFQFFVKEKKYRVFRHTLMYIYNFRLFKIRIFENYKFKQISKLIKMYLFSKGCIWEKIVREEIYYSCLAQLLLFQNSHFWKLYVQTNFEIICFNLNFSEHCKFLQKNNYFIPMENNIDFGTLLYKRKLYCMNIKLPKYDQW